MEDKYYTYMILTKSKKYYVGHTNNIDRRMKEHSNHRTKSMKIMGFDKLVFYRIYLTKSDAYRYEINIKKYSKEKKIYLINSKFNDYINR